MVVVTNPQHLPLSAFTTRYSNRVNRIITKISIFPAFNPDDIPVPPPKSLETKALWDTGATHSVIAKSTVDLLELKKTGEVMVSHAGGESRSSTYIVNFFLPNNVGLVGVPVIECPEIMGNVGAIIGMDIIGEGDFSITNPNGKTCVSFCLPSHGEIDFVKELRSNDRPAEARVSHKVGRNAPCPCGSGKKYKKCCGK